MSHISRCCSFQHILLLEMESSWSQPSKSPSSYGRGLQRSWGTQWESRSI